MGARDAILWEVARHPDVASLHATTNRLLVFRNRWDIFSVPEPKWQSPFQQAYYLFHLRMTRMF
jgi:hypothetical protein